MIAFINTHFFAPFKGLPKAIYALFLARIINAMGLFIHPLLTLIFTKKIGLSESQAGAYVALGGLIFAVASLLGGKLSDHMSRKKLICIFDIFAALCLISAAFLPVGMTLVYMIMLANAFIGLSEPSHSAIVADVTKTEQREQAYSLIYLGFNIGFVVGPALGSLLFESHLNLLFIGDGLTLFIAVLLIIAFVKETKVTNVDDVHADGSILKVLWSVPVLIVFSFLLLGYNFVYSQWGFLVPITMSTVLTNGVKVYGALASFNGLVVIIFTPLITGKLLGISNLMRIVMGGVLYTIGFGSFAYVKVPGAMFFFAFIFTLGEILVTISYMPFIINHTPVTHRGRMSAILPMFIGAGYALGPLIMGRVVEAYSLTHAWQFIGGLMFVSTFLMGILCRRESRSQNKT